MVQSGVFALEKNPSWKGGKTIFSSGYVGIKKREHPRANHIGYVSEAVLVCEKALGKALPLQAIPHHVNHIKTDNLNKNLVICQDTAYHFMLHRRERAYKSCGHAHWRKCWVCQQYDDPKNLHIGSKAYHSKCNREYENQRRHKNDY